MKFFEKLEAAQRGLQELFSKDLADDCINYLTGKLMIELTDKEVLTEEDSNILFTVSLGLAETYESNDLLDLILELSAIARERSHGAAPLSKVYINTRDYKKIEEQLGMDETSVLKVGKVRVYKSETLTTFASAFGICKPKFNCISPELMIILGKVKE